MCLIYIVRATVKVWRKRTKPHQKLIVCHILDAVTTLIMRKLCWSHVVKIIDVKACNKRAVNNLVLISYAWIIYHMCTRYWKQMSKLIFVRIVYSRGPTLALYIHCTLNRSKHSNGLAVIANALKMYCTITALYMFAT